MYFELNEEQRTLRDVARSSFEALRPLERLRERWPEPVVDIATWKAVMGTGLGAIGVPEAAGGPGGDEVDAAVVCEQVGYTALPEPLVETLGVVLPVLRDGASPAQVEPWLPGLLEGATVISVAVDGSDRVRDPQLADGLLLTDGDTVHLVPREDVQLRVRDSADPSRPVADVVAWRRDDTTQLACGIEVVRARAAAARAAALVGLAQRLLDEAVGYASSRTQFGVPIGSFQAVQHQLADVLLAVEQARVAAWYAALRLRDREHDAVTAARVAKLAADRAAGLADRVALQVHGGIGFTWEHDLHLLCKRAATWRASDGDARTHRAALAHTWFDEPTTATETTR